VLGAPSSTKILVAIWFAHLENNAENMFG